MEQSLLFFCYLHICNQALKKHREVFPYKQLWDAAQHVLSNQKIPLTLCYQGQMTATYELVFRDDHLELVGKKHDVDDNAVLVNMNYVEEVVAHPEGYINNPAKMDWDWLHRSLKLSATEH